MPVPSGPIQLSASSKIQSPTGGRARLTVRSALMKVHLLKSSTDDVPLLKSAATTARITCDIGAFSTIGRSTRYQIAPGPGVISPPRTTLVEMPDTNELPVGLRAIGRPASGPGSSIGGSTTSGGNASVWDL